jgi:hypothetical protein
MIEEGGRLVWRIVRGSPGVDLESPVGIVK